MEELKRLDLVKIKAGYNSHNGAIGKIASIVETKGLVTEYDVWLPQEKVTVRLRQFELEKL